MYQTRSNTKEFPRRKERVGGQRLVEVAGYVSAKQRIESLIQAGQRLRAYRESQFDFPDKDKIDENAWDPTRRKGYDLADATQDKLALEARQNARKAVPKPRSVDSGASGGIQEAPQGKEASKDAKTTG